MKIVTIVGARPQFIKAAAVSRVIRNQYQDQLEECLVHTGQHYDQNMSKVFFEELDISEPKYNLKISGGEHGSMTGRMLEGIEKILITEKPTSVLIYGDTNSTLAGALAAAKLHIPIAHVEAGLRSYNMRMPEEVNRTLSDRVSSLLFCPTEGAVKNLEAEGRKKGVYNVGDVMYDVALFYSARAQQRSTIMKTLGLSPGHFVLATCHRAENTDEPKKLAAILSALAELADRTSIVLPLHPRTRKLIAEHDLSHHLRKLMVIEPLSFLDMVTLEKAAHIIITDSGGVQKEAFFYNVPCITIRDETEWIETVQLGWNCLVGASREAILHAYEHFSNQRPEVRDAGIYGNGKASQKIVSAIVESNIV